MSDSGQVALLVLALLPWSLLSLSPRETHLYRIGSEQSYDLVVPSGISRSDPVIDRAATFIAVFFSRFDLPPGDVVTVRSPDMKASFEYTGLGRGESGKTGGFFSGRIPGTQAIVEYKAVLQVENSSSSSNTTLGYHISKYVRGGVDLMRTESVCGSSDKSRPVKCFINSSMDPSLPLAYERSKSVARLFINSSFFCTGWLVGSEGHMFTNHHCISYPAQAAMVDVEFDAESASCEDECKISMGCRGIVMSTSPEFIAASDKLDYALLKLPADIATHYQYLQVRATGGAVLGEQIYIPHYPNGWAKRISSVLSDGKPARIQTLGGTTACGTNQVGYAADTSGGSSGAPIISAKDNAVVALHHCGGCENTAVDMMDIIEDMATKSITVKDIFASAATPDWSKRTPVPKITKTPSSYTPTLVPVSTSITNASALDPPALTPMPTSVTVSGTPTTTTITNGPASISPTPPPVLSRTPASSSVIAIDNSSKSSAPLVFTKTSNSSSSPGVATQPVNLCSLLNINVLCKFSFWCEWDAQNGKCVSAKIPSP